MKILHYLELVYSNYYFNLAKVFKMATNQTKCSRFEQRSVIKFLVPEKCKPCEIYRKMYDVLEEACLRKKK